MATTIPGSINGVANTSTYLHRPSLSAIKSNTSSSYHLQQVTLKAFNTAPIYKSVPVSFYANDTFIGTATFNQVTATFITTALSTGSNTIRAEWPGEGRYAGFTKTLPYTFVVNARQPYPGTMTLTGTSPISVNSASNILTLTGSVNELTGGLVEFTSYKKDISTSTNQFTITNVYVLSTGSVGTSTSFNTVITVTTQTSTNSNVTTIVKTTTENDNTTVTTKYNDYYFSQSNSLTIAFDTESTFYISNANSYRLTVGYFRINTTFPHAYDQIFRITSTEGPFSSSGNYRVHVTPSIPGDFLGTNQTAVFFNTVISTSTVQSISTETLTSVYSTSTSFTGSNVTSFVINNTQLVPGIYEHVAIWDGQERVTPDYTAYYGVSINPFIQTII